MTDRNLWISILMFIVAWYLWRSLIIYPLRLLVTLLHECGHALAAALTGGSTESIRVGIRGNGCTFTLRGSRLIILNGGYLGSVVLGAFVYLLPYGHFGHHAIIVLGILLSLITVLWVRDAFTFIFSISLSLALFFVGWRASYETQMFIARFIGSCCILYPILTINSHFRYGGLMRRVGTDDQELAKLTKIPAIAWQLGWLIFSIFVFLILVRFTLNSTI